jgi:peptidoglycan/LPS O-acetylase OafA/YrhL
MVGAGHKDYSLEGLRGLAALTVVIGHFTFVFFPYLGTAFTPVPGAAPRYFFEPWLMHPPFSLAFSAEAAVCVFFVMSGYVLTTKYYRTGAEMEIQAAAAKRYVRLALPTFASIMFAWVLWKSGAIISGQAIELGLAGWAPVWWGTPYSLLGAVWNGLAGAPLFGDPMLNPPSWSICVELLGSVMLFALIALFGKRPLLFLLWGLFLADFFAYRAAAALYYVGFIAGALLNLARPWLRAHQAVSAVLVVVGLIGCAFNWSHEFDWIRAIPLPNFQPLGPDLAGNARMFWNAVGAIALVAGVLGCVPVSALLSMRPFAFLGRISFSMYLLHAPILMSVALGTLKYAKAAGLPHGASILIAFCVYIPTVMAVATVFFRLADAPSMRLASLVATKRPFASRTAPAEAAKPVAGANA